MQPYYTNESILGHAWMIKVPKDRFSCLFMWCVISGKACLAKICVRTAAQWKMLSIRTIWLMTKTRIFCAKITRERWRSGTVEQFSNEVKLILKTAVDLYLAQILWIFLTSLLVKGGVLFLNQKHISGLQAIECCTKL